MNIRFDVNETSDDYDLRAGDFDSRTAFESEVREFLGFLDEGEPLVISLLPPYTSGFAAKVAFDVIVDVLEETGSEREVRLTVHSERVIDALEDVRSTAGA
ncbi:MAG: hypothetical protein ACQEVA_23220 [Myxococcota bacterium]